MLKQDNMVMWEENCTWVNMVYTMDCHVQPPATLMTSKRIVVKTNFYRTCKFSDHSHVSVVGLIHSSAFHVHWPSAVLLRCGLVSWGRTSSQHVPNPQVAVN